MSELSPSVNAVRKLVVGIIITEYALMEIRDTSKHDLKNRTAIAIAAAKKVQDHFKFHPECTPEHKRNL